MRTLHMLAVSGFAVAALLGGCSGNGSSGAGISTASVLDGNNVPTGEAPRMTNDDPMARPVQVAWTAARAQRCGFNFDAARLKANFLAAETQRGGDMVKIEKSYDQTLASITAQIKSDEGYCSERKSAAIKSDLQRHLTGNFDANLPQEKKIASGGFLDGLTTDAPTDKFDPKTYWEDQAAKRNGAKGAQKTE